ncbi:MAG TPA: VWA domain-containing protein [Tepidisphaeraceae bacterium]|jgi:hypothetical protein|nr:VWA domain-containing protein [Tepidisphaeraceae bacterium]
MTRLQQMIPATAAPAANVAGARLDDNSETPPGLLQRRFVQNVVPFLTSLSVHAAIVILALLLYTAVTVIRPPRQEQVTPAITDQVAVNAGLPQFTGIANIPAIETKQEQVLNNNPGASFTAGATGLSADGGGSAGEAKLLQVGADGGFGKSGTNMGPGSGDHFGDGGPLARFGHPEIGGVATPTFGPAVTARRITFLCDASGSMINKMATLKEELLKAVTGLNGTQSFSIIFFRDSQHPDVLDASLVAGTPQNKSKAGTFLEGVTATGSTNPIPGIEAAFRQNPELIYLLTDGDFQDNDAVLNRIRELNKNHKVRINTIAFVGMNDTDTAFLDLLKTIARESGGKFRHVTEDGGEVTQK